MKDFTKVVTATMFTAALAGCATTKTVDQKIAESQAATNQKIETVAGQVEQLQQHSSSGSRRAGEG